MKWPKWFGQRTALFPQSPTSGAEVFTPTRASCCLWTREHTFLFLAGRCGRQCEDTWSGGRFLTATELCVCTCGLSRAEWQALLFVLKNYARWLRNLPPLWSWLLLFPRRGNLGRRPSTLHHSVRLSIRFVIKKLPSLLKNMSCWHSLTVFCSESRINSETKSLLDFHRQNNERKRALGRGRKFSRYFLNSLSFFSF